MKENKLARRLGCTVDEAKSMIEAYLSRYPAVRQFYQESIEEVRKTGFSHTLLGRRRYLPAILSSREHERCAAERQGCNVQIQGCLPASTRVLTKKGLLPIGVIPLCGEAWTGSEWAPYTKLNRGEWELAELHLSNGQVVRCDTRHKVLVRTEEHYEFVDYENLKIGDAVCLSLADTIEFGEETKEGGIEDFYWMGFSIGNGYTGKVRSSLAVTFGNRKNRYQKEEKALEFEEYLISRGKKPQKRRTYKRKITVGTEGPVLKARWVRLGYPWGKNSHEKTVPTSVWSSPLRMRKAFLLGILDSDGYLHDSTPAIHLCQKPILEELLLLFRTCGVEGTIHGPYQKSESWRLDLNGSQLAKRIGYGCLKSRTAIPKMQIPNSVRKQIVNSNPLASSNSHRVILQRLRAGGTTGAYTARELFLGRSPFPVYATRALVKKVSLGIREETFTLSVDHPSHRFDSEGIISKNTAADACRLAMIHCFNSGLEKRFGVKMLLQVHDELIFEGPKDAIREAMVEVRECMEHPFHTDLEVDLTTSMGIGRSWHEAK